MVGNSCHRLPLYRKTKPFKVQENLEIGIVNFIGQITDQHDNTWHSIFLKRRSRSVIFFSYSFLYNFHKLLLGWYITKKLMIRQVVWGGNDLHQMFRAQLFEGWLVLTQGWILNLGPIVQRPNSTNMGLNFNPVSYSFVQKPFIVTISLFFLKHPIIRL